MGIRRVFKIKCQDGKEIIIDEPIGGSQALGVVSLVLKDKGNNEIASTVIDRVTWEEFKSA